jgi:ribonuclease HI
MRSPQDLQLPLFVLGKDGTEVAGCRSALSVFTDGASRGNPGPSSVGIVIKQNSNILLARGFKIRDTTNNVAEYLALFCAINLISKEVFRDGFSEIRFYADSELLIKQMLGEYKVKDAKLAVMYRDIKYNLRKFSQPYSFHHIKREFNTEADKMANQGLDDKVAAPLWLSDYFLKLGL